MRLTRKIVTLLLLVGTLFSSVPARGTEKRECLVATPVDEPCAGILVPGGQALEALRCLTVELPSCNAKLEAKEKELSVTVQSLNAIIAVKEKENEHLTEALSSVKPAWYEHPALWFSLGVVTTAVLAGVVN